MNLVETFRRVPYMPFINFSARLTLVSLVNVNYNNTYVHIYTLLVNESEKN